MTLILNNENFNETIKEWVTLVDFWAEWCGPCQMMLPIIDDFAESQGDSMKVGKVNVDECPEIAWSFRVMSIPTLIEKLLKLWFELSKNLSLKKLFQNIYKTLF